MYLENIYSPADVKKLSVKELNELSDEIRVSLLQKLSEHGGHSDPTSEWWKQLLPCTMYSILQKIKSYSMYRTKVMYTRC